MRTTFLVAVLWLFAGPTLAFEPWWGHTTSAVRVRLNGAVVETLPKGAMVYVIGEPRPDTLEIRLRFEEIDHFEVAAAYVAKASLPKEVAPDLTWKTFYATGPLVYDVLPRSDDNHIETLDKTGRPLRFATADVGGSFLRVPWDAANHRAPIFGSGTLLVRYFYRVSLLLGRGWFWWLAFLALGALALLADVADGKINKAGIILVYAGALAIGFWFSPQLAQFFDRYAVAGGWMAPYVVGDAGLKPIPTATWVKPHQLPPFPLLMYLLGVPWIVSFIGLHVSALASIPKAVKGIHYLLVRHPLEKQLDGRPLDTKAVLGAVERPASVPFVFVSENFTRRLKALGRRVDAETAVLASAIERERARAAHRDGGEKL